MRAAPTGFWKYDEDTGESSYVTFDAAQQAQVAANQAAIADQTHQGVMNQVAAAQAAAAQQPEAPAPAAPTKGLTEQDFQFYNQQHAPSGSGAGYTGGQYVDWGKDAQIQYNQYLAGQGGFGGLAAGATDDQYRHALGLDTATQAQKDAFSSAAANQGSVLAQSQDEQSQLGQQGVTGSAFGDLALKAAASYFLGPLGGALVGGGMGLASGQDPLHAIGGAAAGYFGGQLLGGLGSGSEYLNAADAAGGLIPEYGGSGYDAFMGAAQNAGQVGPDIMESAGGGGYDFGGGGGGDYFYTPTEVPASTLPPATEVPAWQQPTDVTPPEQTYTPPAETPLTDQPDYSATYTPPESPSYLPSTDQPDYTAPAQPDWSQPNVLPPDNSNYLPSVDEPTYAEPYEPPTPSVPTPPTQSILDKLKSGSLSDLTASDIAKLVAAGVGIAGIAGLTGGGSSGGGSTFTKRAPYNPGAQAAPTEQRMAQALLPIPQGGGGQGSYDPNAIWGKAPTWDTAQAKQSWLTPAPGPIATIAGG